MVNLLKNECHKYFKSFQFVAHIGVVLFSAIVYGILIYTYGDPEALASGSLYASYMGGVLFGILIKPVIPILMILTVCTVIAEDYSSGCMKFFLISKVKKEHMLISKMMFLMILGLFLLTMSFLMTTTIGLIVFGKGNVSMTTVLEMLKVYWLSAVMMFPLIGFTALVALVTSNYQGAIGFALGAYLLFMATDSVFSDLSYYSLTGGLTYSQGFLNGISSGGMKYLITAFVYIVGLFLINVTIMKRKDVVL